MSDDPEIPLSVKPTQPLDPDYLRSCLDAIREAGCDDAADYFKAIIDPIEIPSGWWSKSFTLECAIGSTIRDACKLAARMATRMGHEVRFKFNDRKLAVKPGEDGRRAFEEFWGEITNESAYTTY